MEDSVEDLIGMLNLAVVIANGDKKDKVEIPKYAAVEMLVYLEDFKRLLED